jgi:uncharacterized protein
MNRRWKCSVAEVLGLRAFACLAAGVVAFLGGLAVSLAEPPPASGLAQVQRAHEAYAREIEEWRAARLKRLTSETGWLTLVALHWLDEGENTFGRAPGNVFRLDHPALSPVAGTFVRKSGNVQFIASADTARGGEGQSVTPIDMAPDTTGKATTLSFGSLRAFVIERAGRLGVRVRDVEHSLRRDFKGLAYFPIEPDWVVDARFEPYPPGRTIPIMNVLGFRDEFISPGALVFRREGREMRLDAVLETPDDEELFILFADATSGRETYGAGRFLYVPLPRDGQVKVDFNRSYNPPCAFNEFATCPLPPRQNRLPVRVTAGELSYGTH